MAGAHGDYIKVYIYLLRLFSSSGKSFETSEVANTLDLTESDVLKAIKYWTKKGLVATSIVDGEIQSISMLQADSTKANPIKKEKHIKDTTHKHSENNDKVVVSFKKNYDAKIFDKYSKDEDFILFTKIVGKYFAKTLTVHEINILINLLEKYQISYEALEFLVEHLAENDIKSIKSLESKCISLVENGLTELKEIKGFIRKNNKVYNKILKKLSPSLNKYHVDEDDIFLMDKWLYDYGFNLELIGFACEKTNKFLKSKELKHKINYCNKIIENWHHKGITSLEMAKKAEPKSALKTNNFKKKSQFSFEEQKYDFSEIEARSLKDLEERVKNIQ